MSKRLRPGYAQNKDHSWGSLAATSAPCAACGATPARVAKAAEDQAPVCQPCHRDPRQVQRALRNVKAAPRLTDSAMRVAQLEEQLAAATAKLAFAQAAREKAEAELGIVKESERQLSGVINALMSTDDSAQFTGDEEDARAQLEEVFRARGWASPSDVAAMRESVRGRLFPLGYKPEEDVPSPTGRG